MSIEKFSKLERMNFAFIHARSLNFKTLKASSISLNSELDCRCVFEFKVYSDNELSLLKAICRDYCLSYYVVESSYESNHSVIFLID